MRVRELLRTKGSNVFTVEPHTDIGTAVNLLLRHNIGGLPVVLPDGRAVGLLSERDIVQAVHAKREGIRHLTVEHVMRRPPPTCTADESLHELMSRMTHQRLRHLIVLDDGRVAGVISVGDLVKHRLEQLETETGVLRDYVAAQRAP